MGVALSAPLPQTLIRYILNPQSSIPPFLVTDMIRTPDCGFGQARDAHL
jgi:hypothetical protein